METQSAVLMGVSALIVFLFWSRDAPGPHEMVRYWGLAACYS